MAYARPTFTTPAWDIWQFKKLKLRGKPWSEADQSKAPTLSLHVINGNPRFRLYLNNVNGSTSANPIAFDPYIFSQLTEAFSQMCNSVEADKITVVIKSGYIKNVKLETPEITSTVTVGRDTEGLMYIAVKVKGEPMAIFPFMPSFWANLNGADGESLSPSKASTICAKGWIKLVDAMVASYLVVHTTDPDAGKERPPQQQQSSGSSWGNNNKTFDDDIAF